jgi:ankyrin repeat protein
MSGFKAFAKRMSRAPEFDAIEIIPQQPKENRWSGGSWNARASKNLFNFGFNKSEKRRSQEDSLPSPSERSEFEHVEQIEHLNSNDLQNDTPSRLSRRISTVFTKISSIETRQNETSEVLFSSASSGDTQALGRSLGAGGSVSRKNSQGQTPLHLAAKAGQGESIRCLVRMGASLSAKDCQGYTPLHLAVLNGRINVIPHLAHLGADVNEKTSNGSTSLHLAAGLSSNGFNHSPVRSSTSRSSTSSASTNPRFSYAFGDSSSQFDRRGSESSQSSYNECTMIDALIRAGASLEARDRDGETPLHIAVRSGDATNVKSLVDQGASINVKNHEGVTPLEIVAAAQAGDGHISDILFTHGAIIAPFEPEPTRSWLSIAVSS